MTNFVLLLAIAVSSQAPGPFREQEVARWKERARDVTIIRDDWGIPHVYGKTDADAAFGMVYVQAEDDFNRVETNYLNALGRLAEAEGESAVYQDLRMKLFVDPDSLRAFYRASPAWLRDLMDAFADGKPRIVTVDLTEPLDGDDKICGGVMDVFVERLGGKQA